MGGEGAVCLKQHRQTWRRNNRTHLHFQTVIALRELASWRAEYSYVENTNSKRHEKHGFL